MQFITGFRYASVPCPDVSNFLLLVNEPAEARCTSVSAARRAEGGVRLVAPGTARPAGASPLDAALFADSPLRRGGFCDKMEETGKFNPEQGAPAVTTLSTVYTAAVYGADGYEVTVECSVRRGIPSFEIVGLPDAAIRESEKRIFTGSESSGFPIPSAAVSVNLAPADKRKEGTAVELAVLVAVYRCCGFIRSNTEDMCFIGEISFSGEVRPVQNGFHSKIEWMDAQIRAL